MIGQDERDRLASGSMSPRANGPRRRRQRKADALVDRAVEDENVSDRQPGHLAEPERGAAEPGFDANAGGADRAAEAAPAAAAGACRCRIARLGARGRSRRRRSRHEAAAGPGHRDGRRRGRPRPQTGPRTKRARRPRPDRRRTRLPACAPDRPRPPRRDGRPCPGRPPTGRAVRRRRRAPGRRAGGLGRRRGERDARSVQPPWRSPGSARRRRRPRSAAAAALRAGEPFARPCFDRAGGQRPGRARNPALPPGATGDGSALIRGPGCRTIAGSCRWRC